jgi:RimJ/RimL family protein N-acetyltransferase
MKALLDTHTFLWWNTDDPRLSAEAREVVGDGRNEIYLSVARTCGSSYLGDAESAHTEVVAERGNGSCHGWHGAEQRMTKEPLATKRLILRAFRTEDAGDLFEYLSKPETYRFEPGEPIDHDQAARQATGMAASPDFWAVALKTSGQVIGQIYLKQIEPLELLTCELGYILNPAFQRQGYTSEAAAALVNHALTARGMHRVVAHCNPENVASWKLLEKIGFRREGRLHKNIYFRRNAAGEPLWTDTYVYARLASEAKGG